MLQQVLCTDKMLCTGTAKVLLTGELQICRHPFAFAGSSADLRDFGRLRLLPAQVLPQTQVKTQT